MSKVAHREKPLRLDKWLWAARFYKTRSLATTAINGGHVHLNDERVKPARSVAVGDRVRIRRGALEVTVLVEGLSERRGPAKVAQSLYEETEASVEKRERLREVRKAEAAALPTTQGRPDKRTRRQLQRLKKGQEPE